MKIEQTEEYAQAYQSGSQVRAKIEWLPKMRMEKIVGVVCGYMQVSLSDMMSKSRGKNIAYCRQLCIYFLKKYSNMTYKEIAAVFGGRDPSTAMYSVRKIDDLMQVDENARVDTSQIDQTILGQVEKLSPYVAPGLLPTSTPDYTITNQLNFLEHPSPVTPQDVK